MGYSSLVGIQIAAAEPAGRDTATLGPSDSSDSASDSVGIGEQRSAGSDVGIRDGIRDGIREAADIGVDRVFVPGREAVDDGLVADNVDDADDADEDEDAAIADDEDADLAFIDAAQAADPFDDEAEGGEFDEDDGIPRSRSPPDNERRARS